MLRTHTITHIAVDILGDKFSNILHGTLMIHELPRSGIVVSRSECPLRKESTPSSHVVNITVEISASQAGR